jgi:hypothetical protein
MKMQARERAVSSFLKSACGLPGLSLAEVQRVLPWRFTGYFNLQTTNQLDFLREKQALYRQRTLSISWLPAPWV